jgi:hypothetical protein
MRARDDEAPPAPRILGDLPAVLRRHRPGFRFLVEASDRLGRVTERRVVGVHPHPRQHGGGRHAGVDLLDRRLQQVAELPLGHRHEHIERKRRDLAGGAGVLEVKRPDLRSIAMRQHELMARMPERYELGGDDAGIVELLLPGPPLSLGGDRVATDRDDYPHLALIQPSTPTRSRVWRAKPPAPVAPWDSPRSAAARS